MEGKCKYILILFFVLLSANLRAQSGLPPAPGFPPPHHELPISGGLYYMLAIGAIYGIRVLRRKNDK